MKRITALFAVIVLAATMFAGCDDSTLYRHYDASAYEKQFAAPEQGDTMAEFTTNMGTIVVRLFPKEAPKAVENFVTHAQEGYYDGVIFHRVIADFMIQSGDPDGTGYGGDSIWGGTFEDELCPYLSTYRGALCMANSGTNTNKSQFFIVTRADKDVEVYQRLNMEVDKKYRLDEAKIDRWIAYQQDRTQLSYQVDVDTTDRFVTVCTCADLHVESDKGGRLYFFLRRADGH